ncbi:hypothetical protein VTK26DRAFT_3678 [Humicola hyalothermophila]
MPIVFDRWRCSVWLVYFIPVGSRDDGQHRGVPLGMEWEAGTGEHFANPKFIRFLKLLWLHSSSPRRPNDLNHSPTTNGFNRWSR